MPRTEIGQKVSLAARIRLLQGWGQERRFRVEWIATNGKPCSIRGDYIGMCWEGAAEPGSKPWALLLREYDSEDIQAVPLSRIRAVESWQVPISDYRHPDYQPTPKVGRWARGKERDRRTVIADNGDAPGTY